MLKNSRLYFPNRIVKKMHSLLNIKALISSIFLILYRTFIIKNK